MDIIHSALSLEPDNMGLMKLSQIIISSLKRNLNEVPELMDRAMKLARTGLITIITWIPRDGPITRWERIKRPFQFCKKVWDEAPYRIYTIKSHYEEVKKAVGGQT